MTLSCWHRQSKDSESINSLKLSFEAWGETQGLINTTRWKLRRMLGRQRMAGYWVQLGSMRKQILSVTAPFTMAAENKRRSPFGETTQEATELFSQVSCSLHSKGHKIIWKGKGILNQGFSCKAKTVRWGKRTKTQTTQINQPLWSRWEDTFAWPFQDNIYEATGGHGLR